MIPRFNPQNPATWLKPAVLAAAGEADHFKHQKEYSVLLLSRERGEVIVIDRENRVTVVRLDGTRVVLGVTAPREVLVDREEVAARKVSEAARRSRS